MLGSVRWSVRWYHWLGPVLYCYVAWLLSAEQITEVAIAVVDNVQSAQSRALVRALSASAALEIVLVTGDLNEARSQVTSLSAFGYLVINPLPKGLDVALFYNAQFSLIGKTIASAVSQSYAGVASLGGGLLAVELPLNAPGIQLTALYNINRNYGYFLVPPLILSVWQMGLVAAAAMAWLDQRRYVGNVVAHFLLQLGLIAVICFAVFDWPMRGSWIGLILASLLATLACTCAGIVIATLAKQGVRALSFCALLTAPAFAFMGVTFPVSGMPWSAWLWHQVIPINPFIDLLVQQMHYASPLANGTGSALMLLLCWPTAAIALNIKTIRQATLA